MKLSLAFYPIGSSFDTGRSPAILAIARLGAVFSSPHGSSRKPKSARSHATGPPPLLPRLVESHERLSPEPDAARFGEAGFAQPATQLVGGVRGAGSQVQVEMHEGRCVGRAFAA